MLKPNFKITQANYNLFGTPEQIAQAWKGYDVVCVSHVRTAAPPNGCNDFRYVGMTELITRLRVLNPDQLIFGYVPATADAPVGSGCGYQIPYAEQPWEAPDGVAHKFMEWADLWVTEGVDGIFIDLFASHFISPLMRNNVLSYVRYLKMLAMVNITWPTVANVAWALESPFFSRGDFVLFEGFLVADGVDTEAASVEAMAELRKRPDLHAAPLITTKGLLPVTDAQRRNLLHRAETLIRPGDAVALDQSNLGTL